ncbi:MAG: MFS transporter [Acidobacteriaceae bacterium]|nr:MFS transporter [Acidobacteriaceae bacterium]MBV9780194.1 MFS transporter [Acidobacteriaceae bacterium]
MLAPAYRVKTLHWFALALLTISVCINYADRGNLGVAAKSIELDLAISPYRLGILLSTFSITYATFQLIAGKLIDRWNVNWVYAAGFLVWSCATALTGLANSFLAILCLRLVLGAGESIAYPAYSKIIAAVFPEQLRGTANAMIDAGSKVGPALGVFLGVKMVHWFSWRGMFVAIGGASLVWLLPWCFVVPRLAVGRLAKASAWAPRYRELLSHRALWGTSLGLFGANYGWYFLLAWLPYYLENDRHFTRDRLAFFGSLPFWGVAASSMLFGLVADALIRRGKEPGRVRQAFVCIGLVGCCGFMLPAVLVAQASLSNILLTLACVSMGVFSSNHWALSQRLAGVEAAGKWTGFQNFFGNLPGIISPYVTGITLRETHSFIAAFAIACVVLLFGASAYWFIIGTPTPVSWTRGLISIPLTRGEDLDQPA